jgi:cbb3-type cytochrome oxidase subunit 1
LENRNCRLRNKIWTRATRPLKASASRLLDLLGNIAWLVFGRIRAVHTNLVIFGFVTPALLSVGHFMVPHLLKTQLFSEKLGMLTVILWNIFTAAIVITLSMGMTQGREYAEAIWPIDIAVAIVFVLRS